MDEVKRSLDAQRGKAERDRQLIKLGMLVVGVLTVLLGGGNLITNLLKRDDAARAQAAQAEVLHRLQAIQAEVGK